MLPDPLTSRSSLPRLESTNTGERCFVIFKHCDKSWQRTVTSFKCLQFITCYNLAHHISPYLTISRISPFPISTSKNLCPIFFRFIFSPCFVLNVAKAYINCSICAGPMTFALPAVAGLKSRLVGEEEQGRASAGHRCCIVTKVIIVYYRYIFICCLFCWVSVWCLLNCCYLCFKLEVAWGDGKWWKC